MAKTTYQLVQDFFHQQYVEKNETNEISYYIPCAYLSTPRLHQNCVFVPQKLHRPLFALEISLEVTGALFVQSSLTHSEKS